MAYWMVWFDYDLDFGACWKTVLVDERYFFIVKNNIQTPHVLINLIFVWHFSLPDNNDFSDLWTSYNAESCHGNSFLWIHCHYWTLHEAILICEFLMTQKHKNTKHKAQSTKHKTQNTKHKSHSNMSGYGIVTTSTACIKTQSWCKYTKRIWIYKHYFITKYCKIFLNILWTSSLLKAISNDACNLVNLFEYYWSIWGIVYTIIVLWGLEHQIFSLEPKVPTYKVTSLTY